MRSTNKKLELAWAAGFFDGEGTVYNTKSSTSPRIYPTIGVSQVNHQPLERFATAVGFPSCVYGPYSYQKQTPHYRFALRSAEKSTKVLTLLAPYLSEPKRLQALLAIEASLEIMEANPIIPSIYNPKTGRLSGGHVNPGIQGLLESLQSLIMSQLQADLNQLNQLK